MIKQNQELKLNKLQNDVEAKNMEIANMTRQIHDKEK